MRYYKHTVNEIIDRILAVVGADELDYLKQTQIELIKEEFNLIDKRRYDIEEYSSEIIKDYLDYKLNYKDLMRKYHCSFRKIRRIILECAKTDDRVAQEFERRSYEKKETGDG